MLAVNAADMTVRLPVVDNLRSSFGIVRINDNNVEYL